MQQAEVRSFKESQHQDTGDESDLDCLQIMRPVFKSVSSQSPSNRMISDLHKHYQQPPLSASSTQSDDTKTSEPGLPTRNVTSHKYPTTSMISMPAFSRGSISRISSMLGKAKGFVRSRSGSIDSRSSSILSNDAAWLPAERSRIIPEHIRVGDQNATDRKTNPLRAPPVAMHGIANDNSQAIDNHIQKFTPVLAIASLTIDSFTTASSRSNPNDSPTIWVVLQVTIEDHSLLQQGEETLHSRAKNDKGFLTGVKLEWTIPNHYKVLSQIGLATCSVVDSNSSLNVILRLGLKTPYGIQHTARNMFSTTSSRPSLWNKVTDEKIADDITRMLNARPMSETGIGSLPAGEVTAKVEYNHSLLPADTRLYSSVKSNLKAKPDDILRAENSSQIFKGTSSTLRKLRGLPTSSDEQLMKLNRNSVFDQDERVGISINQVLHQHEESYWGRGYKRDLPQPMFKPGDAIALIDAFCKNRNLSDDLRMSLQIRRDTYERAVFRTKGSLKPSDRLLRGSELAKSSETILHAPTAYIRTRRHAMEITEGSTEYRIHRNDTTPRSSGSLRDVTNQQDTPTPRKVGQTKLTESNVMMQKERDEDISTDHENLKPDPLYSPRKRTAGPASALPSSSYRFAIDGTYDSGDGFIANNRITQIVGGTYGRVEQKREMQQVRDLEEEIDEASAIWRKMGAARGRSVSSEEEEERLAEMRIVGPPFL